MKKKLLSLLLAVCLLLSIVPPVANAAAMTSSQTLIDMMKAREGFSATPYWDHSHYSIGYGTTCPSDKVSYYKNNPMSEEEAEAEFKIFLTTYENAVNNFAAKHNLTLAQHQFDALVSFSYNCGSGWMSSTDGYFNTAVREGKTGAELLYGMALYSTASGQYILIGRRLWEANMYINGDYGEGEKGSYPDNYRWVFLNGNGGTVRYKICAFDTKYNASLPEAFEDIPVGIDANGKTFAYTFAGWYTEGGKKVTKLDSSLTAGQQLYARWTDPQGNVRPDAPKQTFPVKATVVNVDDYANVRTGPGTGYAIAGQADKNDRVSVYEEKKGTMSYGTDIWCRIGEDKWLLSYFLEYDPVETPVEFPRLGQIVGTDSVNVRSGPGSTGYDVVGKLTKGAKISVLEEAAGSTGKLWCKIGENQWVFKDYVEYLAKPTDAEGTALTKLELVKTPNVLKYIQYTVEPDWEGGVLLATYKNGYQKAVTITRSMVSGFDGKKTGSQTVTAKYGGKTVSFAVTVDPLNAPGNFKAVVTEKNVVKLSWQKAVGATEYYVYYARAGGNYVCAGVTTGTSYELSGLVKNENYQVKVVSCYTSDGTTLSGPSTPVADLYINHRMTAPTNLKASQTANGQVKLTWGKATGATHYNVFYRPAGSGSFTLAGTTKNVSYTFADLALTGSYEFKVLSYIVDSSGTEKGPGTPVVSFATSLQVAAPGNLKAVQTANRQVKLTWSAGAGATHYNVFYRKAGAASFALKATTKSLSYTFTELDLAGDYEFKVLSYYVDETGTYKGPGTSALQVSTSLILDAPGNLKAVQTANRQVKLTWSAGAGATHYNVFYRKAGAASFALKATTKNTSYTFTGLELAGDYEFKVLSYYIDSSGTHKGPGTAAAAVSTSLILSAPTNFKATQPANHQVKLTWSAGAGATHYNVFYRKAGSGSFALKATTKNTSYTFDGLDIGGKYEFKVLSYFIDQTGTYKGPGTNALSVTASLQVAAPTGLKATQTASGQVKLTWSAAAGATHYNVFYRKAGAASFSLAGTAKSLSYTVKNLPAGKYEFKVLSYFIDQTGTYKGPGTSALACTVK